MMGAIDSEECPDCRDVLKRVLDQHIAQFLAVGTHACELEPEDENDGVEFVISFEDHS